MYNEVIKKLLRKIEVLPEVLVVMYLVKAYGLTENMARQAIFSACRSRVCYKKGNDIMRVPYLEPNSDLRKKALAFRLVIEFLPDSEDYMVGYSPWIISFAKGNNFVQICTIDTNMEFVSSRMIAEKPIPATEREYIKRIAIVQPGCDLSKIKKAGFTYFCQVDENYGLKIIAKNADIQDAWSDVPEK